MKCVAIMGATSTGKSAVAIALARRFGGEVVSMDSRQVYRGFDIGTGKVTRAQRALVPHHLIDTLEPGEAGSAAGHAAAARAAIERISSAGHLPLLVGGTGLYFRAVFNGLVDVKIPRARQIEMRHEMQGCTTEALYRELQREDPKRAREVAANDRVRITRALEIIAHTGRRVSEVYSENRGETPVYDAKKFVLTMPREILRERVAERTRELFVEGWVEEVRALLDAEVSANAPAMKSLGYAEIASAIERGLPAEEVVERVITLTQQYAKRQETFFRREVDALWIDVTEAGFEERMASAVAAHTGRNNHLT